MNKALLPVHVFIKRLLRNLLIGIVMIVVSLGIGMLGYKHYENMSWVDAYENASMILSGMGPAQDIKTEGGKIFAGTYALFSGIFFLVVIAVIIAPVFHRFFHKFIINQYPTKKPRKRSMRS
jgi:hypothetical protein